MPSKSREENTFELCLGAGQCVGLFGSTLSDLIHTKFKNPFQGKLTQVVVVVVRSMRVDGTILVHLIKVEGMLLEESGREQGRKT